MSSSDRHIRATPLTPRLVTILAGAYVLVGGLVSFLGWVLDVPHLTDWDNNHISIQPNATLAAMAIGAALILLSGGKKRPALVLGALAASIGAATLFEHAAGVSLGIDHLLLFGRTWGATGTTAPGRMGVPASLCWMIAGTGIVLCAGAQRLCRFAPLAGIVLLAVSALALTGYLFGASMLYTLPRLTAIAFQTASFLAIAGVGLVAAVPDAQPMRTLLADTAAGMLLRRALPFIVVLPLLVGWLRVKGQSAGMYDTAMGTALLVLVLMGMLCALLWWGVRGVAGREAALAQAHAQVRQADTALHATELRLTETLESLADGFATFDARWRYTFINSQGERLLGRSRSELLGQNVWEVFPEAVGGKVHQAMRRAVSEQTTVEVEDTDPASGQTFSVRAYPAPDGGVSVYFRDITAEKLAAERVYKSEQQARTLLSVMPGAAAFVVDAELRYLLADGEALRTVGLKPEDLLGKTIFEALDPELAQTYEPYYRRALAGEAFYHEHDAHGRSFVSRGVPLRDEKGEVYAVLAFSHDITDRKAAERELQRLAGDLREADRRKDEFLATLAHELRNPLAPIVNSLEILKGSENDAELVTEIRQTLDRQVGHMVRLVDDLMDVSRITRNKLELRRECVDVSSMLRHAAEASRALIEREGHVLHIALPAPPLYLDADPVRMTQVIANLLTNAAKYTSPGGQIQLSAVRESGQVVIRVKDTGLGIPSDMLDRVFEMFTQVDRSLERAQGGLGIGLSLVKSLVELHGGWVKAHSEGLGKGTEFVVGLPECEPPTAPPGAAARRVPGPALSRRILVVDDNLDSAKSLARLLKRWGNQTQTAHDGVSAVAQAAAYDPDVILLDIGLPQMNGYDACRAIRKVRPDAGTFIVAMTGWGQEEDRARSSEAGFDAHLVKPVDIQELIRMIAALPPRSRGPQ